MDEEEIREVIADGCHCRTFGGELARKYAFAVNDPDGKKVLAAMMLDRLNYDHSVNQDVQKLLRSLPKYDVAWLAFRMGIAYGAALCAPNSTFDEH